ncbi:hypothetical protein [Spiroplasma endosymbiont of Tricholauxania praeusta]|uniref:hypothetical protein n=1 Tax=Spiroplasma endosymbiont of Tricholauxania praeusta TaxID=3066296 RepID=UPI0030CD5D51
MKRLIKEKNNMTKIEFNNKYHDLELTIDADYELRISNEYFTYEDVEKLEQAINDYKKLISEMPQLVKDWLLG